MRRILAAGLFMSILAGCSKRMVPLSPEAVEHMTGLGAVAGSAVDHVQTRMSDTERYIAVRHRLEVETRSGGIEEAVESVVKRCQRLRCEVLGSKVAADSGELFLGVAPDHFKALFQSIGTSGTIVLHITDSEDRTGTVVDVEARLKNLASFRDNLRLMQARSSATVKDLIEIQKELSNVQSELDSLLTRRKVLANETEKVAVAIQFRQRGSRGAFASLASACGDIGASFFDSLATLITFAAAALPWLALFVPLAWLVTRTARRRRARRAAPGATAPATPQP